MPSGFQQSTNQLTPTYYRVSLDLTGYPAINATTNGGVTPNSSDSFSLANLPTTLALGQARARGNIRFNNIITKLSNLADCQILDIEITEANGDVQATALVFTVKFDRADGILDSVKTILGSPYTGYDGATEITTTALALKDQIARAIGMAYSRLMRVFDGTNSQDTQQLITIAAPTNAGNIWADVTVAQIDGTELISVI